MAAVPSLGRAAGVERRPVAIPEVDATRELYERYAHQVHNYCLHQLRSREEAEDAVQTTFMNVFRGLQRGVVPAVEQAWLFKIAENVCLSRRRSSWRRGRIESPNDLEVLQEIIPSHTNARDELIGLEDALGRMPESQRRAILLREWQGLSYREIAAELEISQAAVETLIFRARRTLAEGLEQPEPKPKRTRLRAGYNGVNVGAILTAVKSALTGGAAVKAVVVAVAAGTATIAAGDPPNLLHRGAHNEPASLAPRAATPPASERGAVGARDNAQRFAPNAPVSRSRASERRAREDSAASPLPTLPVEPAPASDDDADAAMTPTTSTPPVTSEEPANAEPDANTTPATGNANDDTTRPAEDAPPAAQIENGLNEGPASAVAPTAPAIPADNPAGDPAAGADTGDPDATASAPVSGIPAADLAPEPAPTDDADESELGTLPTSDAVDDDAVDGANSNAGGNDTAVAGANSNAGGNGNGIAGATSNAGGNDTAVAGANSNAGGNGNKPK